MTSLELLIVKKALCSFQSNTLYWRVKLSFSIYGI